MAKLELPCTTISTIPPNEPGREGMPNPSSSTSIRTNTSTVIGAYSRIQLHRLCRAKQGFTTPAMYVGLHLLSSALDKPDRAEYFDTGVVSTERAISCIQFGLSAPFPSHFCQINSTIIDNVVGGNHCRSLPLLRVQYSHVHPSRSPVENPRRVSSHPFS